MKSLRNDGYKLREIAEVFGVSNSAVRYGLLTNEERDAYNKKQYEKYHKVGTRHDPNERAEYKRQLFQVREENS